MSKEGEEDKRGRMTKDWRTIYDNTKVFFDDYCSVVEDILSTDRGNDDFPSKKLLISAEQKLTTSLSTFYHFGMKNQLFQEEEEEAEDSKSGAGRETKRKGREENYIKVQQKRLKTARFFEKVSSKIDVEDACVLGEHSLKKLYMVSTRGDSAALSSYVTGELKFLHSESIDWFSFRMKFGFKKDSRLVTYFNGLDLSAENIEYEYIPLITLLEKLRPTGVQSFESQILQMIDNC